MRRSFSLLLLAPLAWSATASAGALNPWGATPGPGVLASTTYLYAFPSVTSGSGPINFYPIEYLQYGVSDNVDFMGGLSAEFGGDWGNSLDTLEIMPRYFISDTVGVGLHAYIPTYKSPVSVGPCLHGAWSNDTLDFGLNVEYMPTFAGGFDAGSVNVIAAPERYLTETTSVYLEVDGSYALTATSGAFGAQVVPGVSWSFNDLHYFSLGVQVPFAPTFDAKLIAPGIYYSTSFGG